MSLLDCEDIIDLTSITAIIDVMRKWSILDNNPSNYLLELDQKIYRYNEQERNYMDEHKIEYMPIELFPYLKFNPYAPDDDIISFLIENKTTLPDKGNLRVPYLVCNNKVQITQLTDKIRFARWDDIRPEKIQKFYTGDH